VKDLTEKPILGHLLQMTIPIFVGMLFQTLYFLIDLYFVARLGDASLAGVGAAGNVTFLVIALTQVLGVGTVALISHAAGRKDQADATLVFNQSLVLSATCALITLLGGYGFGRAYMGTLGSDGAVIEAGVTYLYWFLPSLGLQFAVVVMGSALRGTGIVKPTMVVGMLTVMLNAVLAPVLIAGWGTGHPLGVAGAGLASSVAVGVGTVMLWLYFLRLEKYVAFDAHTWRPRMHTWGRVLRIGLPSGAEFALMFLLMGVMYWIIRRFGPDAQAGYGVGQRIMQSLFLPAMAVSFATTPIVGQNYAAGRYARVREAFWLAVAIGAGIMVLLTLLCKWRAASVVQLFTTEPKAVAVGAMFLSIAAWNFVGSGFVFTCSALFQGLGNTVPSLWSSGSRLVSFIIPAFWLSSRPQFDLEELWYVGVASVALQAVVSYIFVMRQFRSKLAMPVAASTAAASQT
jgi:putative MATE family efflux protein